MLGCQFWLKLGYAGFLGIAILGCAHIVSILVTRYGECRIDIAIPEEYVGPIVVSDGPPQLFYSSQYALMFDAQSQSVHVPYGYLSGRWIRYGCFSQASGRLQRVTIPWDPEGLSPALVCLRGPFTLQDVSGVSKVALFVGTEVQLRAWCSRIRGDGGEVMGCGGEADAKVNVDALSRKETN